MKVPGIGGEMSILVQLRIMVLAFMGLRHEPGMKLPTMPPIIQSANRLAMTGAITAPDPAAGIMPGLQATGFGAPPLVTRMALMIVFHGMPTPKISLPLERSLIIRMGITIPNLLT